MPCGGMSASQLIRHFDINLRMTEMTTTSVTGFTLPGPGKLLLVGVRDFADLRLKNRQNPAPFCGFEGMKLLDLSTFLRI